MRLRAIIRFENQSVISFDRTDPSNRFLDRKYHLRNIEMQTTAVPSLQNGGVAGQIALISIWSVVIGFLLVGCYRQLSIWARAFKVAFMVLGISIPSRLSLPERA
jgi:hypothetical protein